jgi:hypothetical protein
LRPAAVQPPAPAQPAPAGRPALTGTRLIDELINEARNGDIGDMSGARARVIGQTAISGALDWAQRSGMKMPKW